MNDVAKEYKVFGERLPIFVVKKLSFLSTPIYGVYKRNGNGYYLLYTGDLENF